MAQVDSENSIAMPAAPTRAELSPAPMQRHRQQRRQRLIGSAAASAAAALIGFSVAFNLVSLTPVAS